MLEINNGWGRGGNDGRTQEEDREILPVSLITLSALQSLVPPQEVPGASDRRTGDTY